MSSYTVLVAEDDDNVRALFESSLTEAGYTVLTARDGEEAVKIALGNHPDLTLMDIVMPKMTGHDAVRTIRENDWGKDAKIAYLTNRIDAQNAVEAADLGNEEYIIKTWTPVRELREKVKELIERPSTAE